MGNLMLPNEERALWVVERTYPKHSERPGLKKFRKTVSKEEISSVETVWQREMEGFLFSLVAE
jgi:hypothetical protein